jgi:hypothetical protein
MENLQELKEKAKILEDRVLISEAKVRESEKALAEQQSQAKQEQKALDDYNEKLAKLKIESVNAVLAGDMAKRRSLEIEIRELESNGVLMPKAQVEAQKATEDSLKAEYSANTKILMTGGVNEKREARKRMNEIESELRKPKSYKLTMNITKIL